MSLLRFACLLVLALWVGGLAALGSVAAPTLFAVLEARDPTGGAGLAGLLFGAILRRFDQASWMLGGVLIILLGIRAALGPRPRRLGVRLWTVAAMLAMSLTSALVLSPRIEAIRHDAGGSVRSLPDGDTRKASFGRLHGASTGLFVLTLIAGIGLFWIEMRDSG
jgi:Domain of unknown function (DUF4149)